MENLNGKCIHILTSIHTIMCVHISNTLPATGVCTWVVVVGASVCYCF